MDLQILTRPAAEWQAWLEAGFRRLGLHAEGAAQVAEALVEAELWGRPTHGFARTGGIAKALGKGLTGTPKTLREGHGHAILDGTGCLGYVVCARAVQLASAKAQASGLAAVGARHSSHNGMLGHFAVQLARRGFVALAATHCVPFVSAFGAREKVLGTNPLALAFPAPESGGDPLSIDLSTAALSWGELDRRRREGQPLPEHVALDEEGRPTAEPAAAAHGTLRPFGAPFDEGKGSALGLAVELLSSLLVGEDPLPDSPRRYGHFFLALQPELLGEAEAYAQGWRKLIERIAGLKLRPNTPPARLPGARAWAHRREALRTGLSVSAEVWREMREALRVEDE
ncbi:MAG: Ldh family oxidoreductase [Planctomycetota bacterium]|nr:Ldh family oxidoreductase [Planctomycetota bacterium]